MRPDIVMLAIASVVLGLGCDKGPEKPSGAPTSVSAGATPAAATVQVPADGRKYEPPVKPEQLPPGVWYCDMGTVHWAQMKEGDKTCPLCKMDLKQKPPK